MDHDRVTIRSVARAAGVSVGTVSHVLNHPERVAGATVSAVLREIERQGFIPRSAARDLAGRVSATVGLIVPDLTNELFLGMSRSAQLRAPGVGFEVLLANSGRAWARGTNEHSRRQAELIRTFAEARVRGIILGAMDDPRSALDAVRDLVPALVVANYRDPDPAWCTVVMDNREVGRLAVRHLHGLGIDEVVFVAPPDVVQPIAERRAGIREAAAQAGVGVTEIRVADLLATDGRDVAAAHFASRRPRRVGVIAVTDALALGILDGIRAAGVLRVPDDVAVLGLDGNHRPAPGDAVGLTSIEPPGPAMGAEALRLLQGELGDPGHVHSTSTVPVTLIPHSSTIGRGPGA